MATIALNLGSSKAGISDMRALILNSSGATIATVTTGFTELSGGQYSWTYSLPYGSNLVRFYSNADPSDTFVTVAVEADVVVEASSDSLTVTAYVYTKNSQGVITPGMTLHYQMIAPGPSGAFDNDVYDVVSDADGLATFEAVIDAIYRVWLENGRFQTIYFTDETTDPYEIPEMVG